ncbi:MAG: Lrp/AsnC family transcriptional regulator [Pseudomonadota bacterium]
MDTTDHKILSVLQRDSRQPIHETARQVGLSQSACHRRISLLEKSGVIEGYGARVNPDTLGLSMSFYLEVSLSSQSEAVLLAFETAVQNCSEILECHLMTGSADYLIRLAARDTKDYESLYRTRIAALPHVARIQSSMVMKTVKPWRGYMR